MAKIINFDDYKNLIRNYDFTGKEAEIIDIKSTFFPYLNNALNLLKENKYFEALKFFNSALEISFKDSYHAIDTSALGILHSNMGNCELSNQYLYKALATLKIIEIPVSIMIYQNLIRMGNKMSEAHKLALKYSGNTNGNAQFFTVYKNVKNELKEPKDYCIDEQLKEAIKAINKRNYGKAYPILCKLYELDRSNVYINYLYHNFDDSFDGVLTTKMPKMIILLKMNKILKAIQNEDKSDFYNLINNEESDAFVNFVIDYCDKRVSQIVFSEMLQEKNNKLLYYSILALFKEGRDVNKEILLIELIKSGLWKEEFFAIKKGEKIIKIKYFSYGVLCKFSLELAKSCLDALSYILNHTDIDFIDLVDDLSELITNMDIPTDAVFFDTVFTKNALIYKFLLRHEVKIPTSILSMKGKILKFYNMYNIKMPYKIKQEELPENVILMKNKKPN